MHRITKGPSPQLPTHFTKELRQLQAEILVRDHTRRPTAAAILAKPILQEKVRKMLAEHDSDGAAKKDDKADKAGAAEGAGGAAPHGLGKVAGPYGDAAGRYTKNQIVEYYSETHKEWLPAQVTAIDSDGRVQVHCKPNAWLSLSQQAHKVRPKQGEGSGKEGDSAKASNDAAGGRDAGGAKMNKPPAMPGHHGGRHEGGGGDGSRGKAPRSASYTPRHAMGYNQAANTPPPYGFGPRGATPPRAQSPFSNRNSPRLAYGRPNPNSAFSPRVIGTPRSRYGGGDADSVAPSQLGAPFPMAGASPRHGGHHGGASGRPPFASNSPRFAPPSSGGGYGGNHYRY